MLCEVLSSHGTRYEGDDEQGTRERANGQLGWSDGDDDDGNGMERR